MTLSRPYSTYEYYKMDYDMRYVALTRTRKYANFCSVDVLKPYTGSIYDARCRTTGKRYLGSAKDVKARWNEHRSRKKPILNSRMLLNNKVWMILNLQFSKQLTMQAVMICIS